MKQYPALRLLGWMAAACLFEGGLGGSSLLASCGDYVMVSGVTVGGVTVGGHGRHGAAPLFTRAESPIAAGANALDDSPCHGPHCSRRSLPDREAPVTAPSNHHDWGISAPVRLAFAAHPLGAVTFDARPRAHYQPAAVFRPPRRA